MHPVTRLGRVVQQLTSFSDLHATDLEVLAAELDGVAPDIAQRLRLFRQVQSDEAQLVVDELRDIQSHLRPAEAPPADAPSPPATSPTALTPLRAAGTDPAVDSPKRARWLAEQARRAQRPLSRRDLFSGPKDQG